jgi:hypothetical protein
MPTSIIDPMIIMILVVFFINADFIYNNGFCWFYLWETQNYQMFFEPICIQIQYYEIANIMDKKEDYILLLDLGKRYDEPSIHPIKIN